MISNIECLRDPFGENRTITSFTGPEVLQSAEYYNTSRSIPLWYDNTMEALLLIRCYMCNGLLSDNFEPIIIRKTGRKIFRIETRCSECKKIKSKKFCDTFNKLSHEMYQLVLNKIYIDYTPSGIKFTDLSKNVYREDYSVR